MKIDQSVLFHMTGSTNCQRQHTINELSITLVFIGMVEIMAENEQCDRYNIQERHVLALVSLF